MKRLLILLFLANVAQANQQEGSLNTYNSDSTVSSNNTTTDTSTTNNYNGAGSSSEMPVGSAISPSYMSNGVDTCLKGSGGSVQTVGVGISSGNYELDENCLRLRESKLLADLNMKVAAVSRLCDSIKVFRAMLLSGTPCPIISGGRLVAGRKGLIVIKQQPELYIPDYDDNKDWYNGILQIGEATENVEEDYISIVDKFRSSRKRTE